jgi:hypothetical protein
MFLSLVGPRSVTSMPSLPLGLRRDKSPRLGDSLRRDGFVSEYRSPGSGAKP